MSTSARRPSVLVLGGGPDAEREVSIKSSTAIARALAAGGRFDARLEIIRTITPRRLRSLRADVLFPYLHGPWGEGGPLQDIIEADGRAFVGSDARASRLAMDKVATKAIALVNAIPTPPVCILNPADSTCPLPLPVIVKPVHEGSTIGLHVCNDERAFARAIRTIQAERRRRSGPIRTYMIEPKIAGEELTVGVIGGKALPPIKIIPKSGLYDYKAKYLRNDTQYLIDPPLQAGLARRVQKHAVALADAIGCRHISRTDFMVDKAGTPWLLEINTTPGFTDHSLVPKAAAHAGIPMPRLCERLVQMALDDHSK